MSGSASPVYDWKIGILLVLVGRNHPVHKGPVGPKPEPRLGHGEQLAGRAGQAANLCASCAWSSARVSARKGG